MKFSVSVHTEVFGRISLSLMYRKASKGQSRSVTISRGISDIAFAHYIDQCFHCGFSEDLIISVSVLIVILELSLKKKMTK